MYEPARWSIDESFEIPAFYINAGESIRSEYRYWLDALTPDEFVLAVRREKAGWDGHAKRIEGSWLYDYAMAYFEESLFDAIELTDMCEEAGGSRADAVLVVQYILAQRNKVRV